MPEQALYLKWRPLDFEAVVGQEHVTRTIRNSIKTGRIRHAYLFSGPRGTGKTTSARLLAKAVNCLEENLENRPCNECAICIAVNEGRFLDLIEIDAASHTGVDDVRDLRDKIAFAPGEGRYKVYIIDEVHRFSGNAFDALLKTLEEPPDHAIFILATTEIDRVPATIKSRCLPFEFRRLSLREVTARLTFIAEQEGLSIEQPALELIAREGTGSVRDSISLLDQIVADPDETITLELAQRILGTASTRSVKDLIEALLKQEIGRGLHIINHAVDAGTDPRQFGQQVVEHLRNIMLAQTASSDLLNVSEDDRALFANQAQQVSRSLLLRAIRSFNDAVNNYTGGWQPQLALELALIESLQQSEPAIATPGAHIQRTQPQQPQAILADTQTDYERPPSSPPGLPPVISVAEMKRKWQEAQTLIFNNAHMAKPEAGEIVTNLPSLMDHAHILRIEGNNVTVGVSNFLLLDKLRDETRLRWIERAILRVTDKELRVNYVLVDGDESIQADTDPVDDPLIQEGLDLGGKIREEDE